MDGDTTITIPKDQARNHATRIAELVKDLEADGYRIGMTEDGSSYYVKMSEIPTPDVDAYMRFKSALKADEALNDHLLPWLRAHRPFGLWGQQIADMARRPRT